MTSKQLIIGKITGLSKEQLFLNQHILSNDEKKLYDEYIKRLNAGEPIEYILKEAEFYGNNFYIDNRVLIPRNDSEVMVDSVLCSPLANGGYSLIDVGTGSSCIAISVMKKIQKFKCYVVDISDSALEVSKINIEKYKLEDKITLIKGDLLNPFLTSPQPSTSKERVYELGKNIIITANLPYIKDEDYKNMDDSVIKYEPKIALYGGKETGFELYQKLINQCLGLKKNHKILLFIEIGFDQKQIAEDFLNNLGLKYETFKDNGGVDRCIKIYFE